MKHKDVQISLGNCTQWRRSSYSFPAGQQCVEITTELTGWIGIRDSKLGAVSPILAITTKGWHALLASAS